MKIVDGPLNRKTSIAITLEFYDFIRANAEGRETLEDTIRRLVDFPRRNFIKKLNRGGGGCHKKLSHNDSPPHDGKEGK